MAEQWHVAKRKLRSYEELHSGVEVFNIQTEHRTICTTPTDLEADAANARLIAAAPEMHAILTELAQDAEEAASPMARLPWYDRIADLLGRIAAATD